MTKPTTPSQRRKRRGIPGTIADAELSAKRSAAARARWQKASAGTLEDDRELVDHLYTKLRKGRAEGLMLLADVQSELVGIVLDRARDKRESGTVRLRAAELLWDWTSAATAAQGSPMNDRDVSELTLEELQTITRDLQQRIAARRAEEAAQPPGRLTLEG